jgi:hypothetical protein
MVRKSQGRIVQLTSAGKKLVDEGGSFLEGVVTVAMEFNVLCSKFSHILCLYHCFVPRF